ncbi:hypothetical protein GGH99_007335 [Coemansia sp. RSA 1285]|nr:hypothetical protein GGH99_007335 [Coemansia sp. RSA 1285]
MVFMCKKCKKAFRKNANEYEDADEYCPHCDNHYVIEAKTPIAALGVEGDDARVDNRMIKDDRIKAQSQSVFIDNDLESRLS